MGPIILGAVVLLVAVWALYGFARIDPKVTAQVLRKSGGIAALAGAAFLTARGQVGLAVPLGFAGLSLLGWVPGMASLGKRMNKSTGQTSQVRSDFVEMELDHDTGAMRGRILKGRMEGVTLDALDVQALMSLLPEVDEESRALLMAYLDRREPSWREHANAGAAAGASDVNSGKMTEEEAYQILGVEPGASAADIGRAHRALMKKLHPDQGGSTYLAARVNQAKDLLLKRHR
ncbi:DnaJ domain-containing protein [Pseudorhodoplanes sp.]|uniref:DnaJ domain-containing protein n=1 Tax=Pseudorhodoplanes sp. TaxID=1934341 RepID=UPI002C477D9C|nr:DnaJ domain-containing protein [Pseudorhodoplanes sp.]HWV55591.1 DnaJ domain-containing protein [Pseudorhodoplanes sp.]